MTIQVEMLPLKHSWDADQVEAEIKQVFIDLFEEYLRPRERDLNVYGMPHLGSFDLVSRNIEKDGLALPNNGDEHSMRYLYKAWTARNPKKGLHFLRTYLQMIWGDETTVYQLWHDKDKEYPLGVTQEKGAASYLTSRIRVVFGSLLDATNISSDIRETLPALRSILAAEFILEIYANIQAEVAIHESASFLELRNYETESVYQEASLQMTASAPTNSGATFIIMER